MSDKLKNRLSIVLLCLIVLYLSYECAYRVAGPHKVIEYGYTIEEKHVGWDYSFAIPAFFISLVAISFVLFMAFRTRSKRNNKKDLDNTENRESLGNSHINASDSINPVPKNMWKCTRCGQINVYFNDKCSNCGGSKE